MGVGVSVVLVLVPVLVQVLASVVWFRAGRGQVRGVVRAAGRMSVAFHSAEVAYV